MSYELLETVVLERDLPEIGLRRGDLGTVVEIYSEDTVEVEFVTASGETGALLTLTGDSLRSAGGEDLIAVRSFKRSA